RASGQGRVRDLQIDEAGAGDLDRGQARITFKPGGDAGGQVARVGAHRLGGGQGAVGLEVGQVGPVRGGDAHVRSGHAFGGEGGPAWMRKRRPDRLNSAISGETSKPARTSKLSPATVADARGISRVLSMVTEAVCRPSKLTGRSKYSLARTARFRSVTAIQ